MYDLEKAYDTNWKHVILYDLWDLGFRGHLPISIDGFLPNRLFKVSTLSELHEHDMGVPHGSVISPAVFSIKINNNFKSVLKGTDSSLLVDEFCLVYSGKVGTKSGESYAIMYQQC